jgi:hypothetical protein
MPVEVKGGLALRKALKEFAPDLAKETRKELAVLLKPIVSNARGFIPSQAPLSGWGKSSVTGRFPEWSSSEAKSGIGFKTTPSKPNRSGFRSLARIQNASPSGAIYETAGRLNPNGRSQAKRVTFSGTIQRRDSTETWSYETSAGKNYGRSNNPEAGSLFVQSMNQYSRIVDANNQVGRGRRSRKMKGRAIYRAWAEDGGKTTAAVLKAIENSNLKFQSYTLKAK